MMSLYHRLYRNKGVYGSMLTSCYLQSVPRTILTAVCSLAARALRRTSHL